MSQIEESKDYRFEVKGNGILKELVLSYCLPDEDEERKYGISVNGIGDVVRGTNTSEWIHQLYNKTWVSKNMLYDLAKEIQRISPANGIDWKETFFMVEKYYYLQDNWQDETPDPVSLFGSFRSKMKYSADLANDPKFNEELRKQVLVQLENRNLI